MKIAKFRDETVARALGFIPGYYYQVTTEKWAQDLGWIGITGAKGQVVGPADCFLAYDRDGSKPDHLDDKKTVDVKVKFKDAAVARKAGFRPELVYSARLCPYPLDNMSEARVTVLNESTTYEGLHDQFILIDPPEPLRAADAINHPPHYTSHPSGIECIIVTRWMTFNLGNAVKYVWRAGLKSENPIEDLKKAVWYLNDEITRLQGLQA